ncbi:phosphatase PAP2 family protein [Terrarubrum flagellatum]|uniref:phosphatase PAP2 family protein n=1 Tax=Terrirubrum flagellatum TaxID=2895980 RepID=UPI0031453857
MSVASVQAAVAARPSSLVLSWLKGVIADPGARAIWGVILFLALSVAVTFPIVGLSLVVRDVAFNLTVAAAALAGSCVYGVFRPDPRLSRLLRGVPEIVLTTYFGGALSYAATAAGLPLWDATFARWDSALGLDWVSLLKFYEAHPRFYAVLACTYYSMLPQIALLLLALATMRAFLRLDAFIFSFGLAAIVTMAIATLMPSVCAGEFHAASTGSLLNIRPNWDFAQSVHELRAGSLTSVKMAEAKGLVSFPSFHAICAILITIAFWRVPYLRWAALVLNLAMLAATPIEGGHYFVDLIAGAVIAIVAWAIAQRVVGEESGVTP